VKKIKTHISYSITFFLEIHAVYEIMWKNIVDPDRPDEDMAYAHCCWIPKPTNTHSEYVITIAFPQ
jgi:hypothetical protein